ncbi:MAG TPA: hypothetical protein EYP41_13310 [Anaerolineae bacterium]|nr:hypothetical protein [Anaerolineae bacterium]
MTKQRKSKASQPDPLEDVPLFDPSAVEKPKTAVSRPKPASPLGPPQKAPLTQPLPVVTAPNKDAEALIERLETELATARIELRRLEKRNLELETAVAQHQATLAELKQEREIRLNLERELATLEVIARQSQDAQEQLETERQERIALERKMATLEVLSERAQDIAAQLAKERDARVILEREKATLEVQVQSMAKLDTLLNEERQARMNAQNRAATAEARLARLEGEINQKEEDNGGFFGRLRGGS